MSPIFGKTILMHNKRVCPYRHTLLLYRYVFCVLLVRLWIILLLEYCFKHILASPQTILCIIFANTRLYVYQGVEEIVFNNYSLSNKSVKVCKGCFLIIP